MSEFGLMSSVGIRTQRPLDTSFTPITIFHPFPPTRLTVILNHTVPHYIPFTYAVSVLLLSSPSMTSVTPMHCLTHFPHVAHLSFLVMLPTLTQATPSLFPYPFFLILLAMSFNTPPSFHPAHRTNHQQINTELFYILLYSSVSFRLHRPTSAQYSTRLDDFDFMRSFYNLSDSSRLNFLVCPLLAPHSENFDRLYSLRWTHVFELHSPRYKSTLDCTSLANAFFPDWISAPSLGLPIQSSYIVANLLCRPFEFARISHLDSLVN
ncbi:hypothetical protein B0H11DRAFT_2287802 [Mycena galericulata]|nr:hypothetical protein B0H11DRAFT_2287802 [Mycena galericulata]